MRLNITENIIAQVGIREKEREGGEEKKKKKERKHTHKKKKTKKKQTTSQILHPLFNFKGEQIPSEANCNIC